MSPSTHRRRGLPRRRTAGLAVAAALAVSGLVAAPQVAAAATDPGSPVKVNQVAYVPGVAKVATLVSTSTSPVAWTLRNAAGTVVASGQSTVKGADALSGDSTHLIDFSTFDTPGSGYVLSAANASSYPFDISADPVKRLRYDSLAFFYHQRSGIAIDAAVRRQHLRARRRSPGRRAEPGRHERAVPRSRAATAWTCAAAGTTRATTASTSSTAASPRGSCRTPTSGPSTSRAPTRRRWATAPWRSRSAPTVRPDILDEARWEVEFLLRMQVPAGRTDAGMVHHKIHDENWTGLPMLPAQDSAAPAPVAGEHRGDAQPGGRGGAGVAAVEDARPDVLRQGPRRGADGVHRRQGEPEPDRRPRTTAPAAAPTATRTVTDEFYWAAAELYATTGSGAYRADVTGSSLYKGGSFDAARLRLGLDRRRSATRRSRWSRTGCRPSDVAATRAAIVTFADAAAGPRHEPGATRRPTTPASVYYWGSNGQVANNAERPRARVRLHRAGEVPHRRVRRARLPPGPQPAQPVLHRRLRREGGPERAPPVLGQPGRTRPCRSRRPARSPAARTASCRTRSPRRSSPAAQPQKCFVDDIEAYSVNEVAINWNSALAWLASWAAEHAGRDPCRSTPRGRARRARRRRATSPTPRVTLTWSPSTDAESGIAGYDVVRVAGDSLAGRGDDHHDVRHGHGPARRHGVHVRRRGPQRRRADLARRRRSR